MGKYKHGEIKTRLYKVWNTMKQRCNDPNGKEYHRYGGRGIRVCDEWLTYTNFRDWAMENGYDKNAAYGKCTLDRIDNDGNYEPSNCRWISLAEQCNNRVSRHTYTYRGETLTISEWSKRTGIAFHTLFYRIKKGWDENTIFTPSHTIYCGKQIK